MVLTLYKTDIRPEMNAVVEDFELYMNDEDRIVHQWQNVKYTQPEIDIMLKLPLDGHYNSLGEFNYACLHDPDTKRDYFYFVVDFKWKARMTLQLQLSMDTLNTFWDDIKTGLSPNTHVTRRYFDRWKKSDNGMAYPIINRNPEDIAAPSMVRSYEPQIVGNETEHWTLVYKTEYDYKDSLNQNPVVCFAIPSKSYSLQEQYNYRTLTTNSFELNTAIAFDFEHTPATQIWINGALWFDSKINDAYAIIKFAQVGARRKLHLFKHDANGDATEFADSVEIKITVLMYRQASWVDTTTPKDQLTWIYPILVGAQQLGSFDKWYTQNKADPTIVKIIELPYAPFDIQEDANGKIAVPDGWNVAPLAQMAVFSLFDAEKMEGRVAIIDNLGPESFDPSTVSSAAIPADPENYETKLWNSSYRTVKFAYDNNFHVVRLEQYAQKDKMDYPIGVLYKASSGMDGSCVFTFQNSEKPGTDYGEYLICNRSTEIPFYNNEYLNYVRYGKSVDEKNRGMSIASTAVGGIGSTAQTAAALGFALTGAKIASGAAFGGIVGGVVGLASTSIAVWSSIYKANEQINSKIDQYTHQASGSSGISDLSVFKTYGKNKLLMMVYRPAEELRASIGRYFELYGYACDEYGVPNWNTRIWSDYFVMEPKFIADSVFGSYEADISSRMQSGFRVLHRVAGMNPGAHYDFECEYENFERGLFS